MNFIKSLTVAFVVHTISFSASAQTPSCKSLHTGSFKVSSPESGPTYIKRTRTQQIEKNDEIGYELILELTWIDECTYELRPKKLVKGDPSILGDGNSFVRTKIKNITANGYTAETTSSFSDDVVDFYVEIIRDKDKK